ncbi:hypothetical protein [Streptomyces sp. NBC_00289]|uniref:hypothetical protein n=1 Tax=Streptomyces sp. NBC_00289 TaxID=2975703 RepID=UPI00352CEE4B
MFDDLPPGMARLLTLRVWHTLWLQRIDTEIAAIQQREAEQEHGRTNRPAEPDWIVELGIGAGRPPVEVHVRGCYAAGRDDAPSRARKHAGFSPRAHAPAAATSRTRPWRSRTAGRRRVVTRLRPKAPSMTERLAEDIVDGLDE